MCVVQSKKGLAQCVPCGRWLKPYTLRYKHKCGQSEAASQVGDSCHNEDFPQFVNLADDVDQSEAVAVVCPPSVPDRQ